MKTKIILSEKAKLQMKYFVDKAPGEISGLCKSFINENGDVYVTDCVIFEQVSSAAHTELSEQAMAKFLVELVRANDDPQNWNIWWHSHANMDVFWSATDNKTIEDTKNQSYLISIVTNKAGKYKARIDLFPTDNSPFKQESIVTYQDVPVYFEGLIGEDKEKEDKLIELINKTKEKITELHSMPEIEKHCQEEIEAKLKAPTPVITHYTGRWWEKDEKKGSAAERGGDLKNLSDEERMEREMCFGRDDDFYDDVYGYDNDWYYEGGILKRRPSRQNKLPMGMY